MPESLYVEWTVARFHATFCLFRCIIMEAHFNNEDSRLAVCASRAVGVPKDDKKWYIAVVGFNTEKSSNRKLTELGYETYLPLQNYISVWKDGRRKKRERIVIPTIIFTKLTEEERQYVVKLPFISNFMVNNAVKVDKFNRHPIATVPDEQIRKLQFMLGQNDTEVLFDPSKARMGDKVRIIRGSLASLEGTLCRQDEKNAYVVVQLDYLGSAKIEVSMTDIEQIK